MAKALGDDKVYERLNAAAEQSLAPTFFGDQGDRFSWWPNKNEPYPRGTTTAQQMISEIAEGSWLEAFQVKHLDKYSAPTLEGVDYPSLGVEQAWNDKENGVLHLRTYTGERGAAGRNTTWRITNLPNAAETVVIKNGERLNSVQVLDANTIRVETDIGMHQYKILTGYFGQSLARTQPDPMTPANVAAANATRRSAEQNAKAAEAVMVSGSANCPCCSGAA